MYYGSHVGRSRDLAGKALHSGIAGIKAGSGATLMLRRRGVELEQSAKLGSPHGALLCCGRRCPRCRPEGLLHGGKTQAYAESANTGRTGVNCDGETVMAGPLRMVPQK